MYKKILLKLFVLPMNDISTTRFVIIIIFGQDTLLIIGTINHKNVNRNMNIWDIYRGRKRGFGAFKNITINMLLF